MPQPCCSEVDAESDRIWKYVDRVCRTVGLRKYMKFNSKLLRADWNQERGKCILQIEKSYIDDVKKTFEDECVNTPHFELVYTASLAATETSSYQRAGCQKIQFFRMFQE